jgi:hypothetical protein
MLRRLYRKLDRQSPGPPPVVLALLGVELLALVVLVLVGTSLSYIALALGPVTAVTMAFLNPIVQEWGRPQPKLSIVAQQDRNGEGTVDSTASRPWPVDVDRVVANEMATIRATLAVQEEASTTFIPLVDSVFDRPSKADVARARDACEQELPSYEQALREWLTEYSTAARDHSQIFDLVLQLNSARGGAYAESVTVSLDLPATIKIADERPVVPLPPEPPRFKLKRRWHAAVGISLSGAPVPTLRLPELLERGYSVQPAPWKITEDGQRLETSVGEVHAGRCLTVGRPLLLLANGAGHHEIRWTVYTKSARRHAHGTITLVVPPDVERPAFGRLHGITSFPDVSIVDHDDEVVYAVRETDPPSRPPAAADTSDIRARLRQTHRQMEWEAFGLDPAADGPESAAVSHAAQSAADNLED